MSTFSSPLNSGDVAQNAVGYVLMTQASTLTFADTAAKALFNIPKPYQIVDVYIDVTTVFNSSGTDLVTIGFAGTQNAFATAIDVASTGRKRGSAGAAQLANFLNTTDDGTVLAVTGLFTQSVADATTGAANIVIVYSVPKTLAP